MRLINSLALVGFRMRLITKGGIDYGDNIL